MNVKNETQQRICFIPSICDVFDLDLRLDEFIKPSQTIVQFA